MSVPRGLDPTPILDLIDRRGWSDREAANELGVGYRAVLRWRAGLQGPSVDTLDRIAIHLGHHPASLWGADWDAAVPIRKKLLAS